MLIGSDVYSIVTYLLSENWLDASSDYWRMRSSHENDILEQDSRLLLQRGKPE